jgi:hypothetical protein
MAQNPSPSRWPKWRRAARWLRISLLTALFLAVAVFSYLNQIGLPDFIKDRLLAELRARGFNAQFTRLRLTWFRGIVAEEVQLGKSGYSSPHLAVREAELRLHRGALAKFQFQIKGIIVRNGRIVWPLAATNESLKILTVDNISAELRFSRDDHWLLDQFKARSLGANLSLKGDIKNGSHIRAWEIFRPSVGPPTGVATARLRKMVTAIQETQFTEPPEIKIIVFGDARDPNSFAVDLAVHARDASGSWGELQQVRFASRLVRDTNHVAASKLELRLGTDRLRAGQTSLDNAHFNGEFSLSFSDQRLTRASWELEGLKTLTPWIAAKDLRLSGTSLLATNSTPDPPPAAGAQSYRSDLQLNARELASPWGTASATELRAELVHSFKPGSSLEANGKLSLRHFQSATGALEQAELSFHVSPGQSQAAPSTDGSWGWWTNLAPFRVGWDLVAKGIASPKVRFEEVGAHGLWQAPELKIDRFDLALADRHAVASANLDVATRRLAASISSDINPHEFDLLLTTNTLRFFRKLEWARPPLVDSEVALVLPAWTNRHPDWRREVEPTLQINGKFSVGPGAYKTIPVLSAESHFSFSNRVWTLPDLRAARPEGLARLHIVSGGRPSKYRIDIQGNLDPKALEPLLGQGSVQVLDLFDFPEPVGFDGAVWGPWGQQSRDEGVSGKVSMTNFTFRGERFSQLTSSVRYTNAVLIATDTLLRRDDRRISAPATSYDFDAATLSLSNALCNIDPLLVAAVISSKLPKILAPYRFENPPEITVNGSVHTRGRPVSDLRLDVSGGPFSFWKFHMSQIHGEIWYATNGLTISNLQSAFYNGRLNGEIRFDLSYTNGAEFSFKSTVADADLALLMRDLSAKTNKLEGLLTGELNVTTAKTADLKSWEGFGDVFVRNGLLWDIPAFGIFSSVLNSFSPGLGNSRIDQAMASFVITNSVIFTDDLEMRAPSARLQYRGTVDFDGNLHARVEAELLRDTWARIIGLVLAPMTKLFEYRVTGTLREPKKEPLHWGPRLILMPFHPVRTIKDLLPGPEPEKVPVAPKTNRDKSN